MRHWEASHVFAGRFKEAVNQPDPPGRSGFWDGCHVAACWFSWYSRRLYVYAFEMMGWLFVICLWHFYQIPILVSCISMLSCVYWCEIKFDSKSGHASKYANDKPESSQWHVGADSRNLQPATSQGILLGLAPQIPEKRNITQNYCWWLKSCTTWDVWNPIMGYLSYQLV